MSKRKPPTNSSRLNPEVKRSRSRFELMVAPGNPSDQKERQRIIAQRRGAKISPDRRGDLTYFTGISKRSLFESFKKHYIDKYELVSRHRVDLEDSRMFNMYRAIARHNSCDRLNQTAKNYYFVIMSRHFKHLDEIDSELLLKNLVGIYEKSRNNKWCSLFAQTLVKLKDHGVVAGQEYRAGVKYFKQRRRQNRLMPTRKDLAEARGLQL